MKKSLVVCFSLINAMLGIIVLGYLRKVSEIDLDGYFLWKELGLLCLFFCISLVSFWVEYYRIYKEDHKFKIIKSERNPDYKKIRILSVFCGFLFSLFFVLGFLLNNVGYTAGGFYEIIRNLLLVLALTPAFACLTKVILYGLIELNYRSNKSGLLDVEYKKSQAFFYWAIIFLFYLIVLLAYYPGIVSYDAKYQIMQVVTGNYKTNHPLIHTMLLGGFYLLGEDNGTYEKGIFLYSLFQILFLSGTIAYGLDFLRQLKVSKKIAFILAIFYGIFPIYSILSISTTKDVICGGFLLLYVVELMKCYLIQDYFKWKKCFGIIFVAVGMILFRNNLLYAFLLTVPVLMIGFRNQIKKILFIIIGVFLFYSFISKAFVGYTNASTGSLNEIISVPVQQIARTVMMHKEEMSQETLDSIYFFIPEDLIEQYSPIIADPVKNNLDVTNIHDYVKDFLMLWFDLGLQYPLTYIDSFLFNTSGYWYIGDTYHRIIYGEGGYLITSNQSIWAGYTVYNKSYIPVVTSLIQNMFSKNQFANIPILCYLFTPAFFMIGCMIYICMIFYNKNYKMLVPFSIILASYVSLLLGPVVLIRYLFGIILVIPIFYGTLFVKSKE